MLGWLTREPYSASRRKRFTAIGSWARRWRRILTAACRARVLGAIHQSPCHPRRCTSRGGSPRPFGRPDCPRHGSAKLLLDASRSQPLTFAGLQSCGPRAAQPGRPRCVGSSLCVRPSRRRLSACGSWKRVGTQDAAGPLRARSPGSSTHAVLSEARAGSPPADPLPFVGTVAFAAGPGRLRHRRPRALAREPRARLPARRQRLRRALPGRRSRSSARARRRWTSRGKSRCASPPSRRPAERREHPLPAGAPARARRPTR